MNIPDNELIISFREGNDIAFITLYNRYKVAVYNFCLKMLGDPDSAKDTVQSVFIKIYERHSQLEQPGRFRQWLFAIARNESISYLRKNKIFSPLHEETEKTKPDPVCDSIERDSEVALVNDAIGQLETDLREVLILREYQGLSYHEIGEIVGIPERTVKSRLYRARQIIYEILKPHFKERN
jgi:RNA polymerase sigma-70 factor (ECF subfamily)